MNCFISFSQRFIIDPLCKAEDMHSERHISYIIGVRIVERTGIERTKGIIKHMVGNNGKHTTERQLFDDSLAVYFLIVAAINFFK